MSEEFVIELFIGIHGERLDGIYNELNHQYDVFAASEVDKDSDV